MLTSVNAEPAFDSLREPEKKVHTLAELSVTVWLCADNASFYLKNNFLYLSHGETEHRAFLCRIFPFECEWDFISVLNEEGDELGIIKHLDDFDADTKALLHQELQRRYYAPLILSVLSVKERYGFSYWKVKTAEGEVNFTLHDTFRSIIHAGPRRLIMLDVNGNRFEIADTSALDRKSYKKIELYL